MIERILNTNISRLQLVVNPRTGERHMDIGKYIDRALVDEYVEKDDSIGYYLEVQSLSQHEKDNLLDTLWKHDPITREIIEERMQDLINNRVELREQEDRYYNGQQPEIDRVTGETKWVSVNY